MGLNYLLDTNTAIDYLDDKLPDNPTNIIDTNEINLSVITRIELLAWSKSTSEQVLAIQNFISSGRVYALDEPIILQAIEIRKNYKPKLPDAIIAATALVNDYTLISRNIDDFKNINGLRVIDPWKM